MDTNLLDTHQKAVQINLDNTKYGTFAEIGAGQEVARLVLPGRRGGGHDRQEHLGLRHDRLGRHLRRARDATSAASGSRRCSTTSTA